jgi:hypothetical protein
MCHSNSMAGIHASPQCNHLPAEVSAQELTYRQGVHLPGVRPLAVNAQP